MTNRLTATITAANTAPIIRTRKSILRILRLAILFVRFTLSIDPLWSSLRVSESSYAHQVFRRGHFFSLEDQVGEVCFAMAEDFPGNLHCRDNHRGNTAAGLRPVAREIEILHEAVERRSMFSELVR